MTFRKYNNRKTTIDGYTFDSKKEADYYIYLRSLVSSGEITDLQLQPVFLLQEKFKYDGKTERAITYVADFQYSRKGVQNVVDVKGMKTEVYKIKRKLFLKKYPEYVFQEI